MASLFDRLQARRLHPRPLFRRRPPLRHLPACVLAGALWALALSATATEPIPGHSLESIRAWVLEHNPELRAMDFEAQAAEARIQPAGALPDPNGGPSLYCAVIVKRVDAQTRAKTGVNELLRD